jgi:hypothetical protein
VYRLDVTPEIFAAQLPMYGDEAQCRDHFSSVVLIEAIAYYTDSSFNLHDFTQPNALYPHNSAQAAWDECLLSLDGESVLARGINCVKGSGPLRFAFYLHYWAENLSLQWTYGEVSCPKPLPMPDRLKRVAPYRPCD